MARKQISDVAVGRATGATGYETEPVDEGMHGGSLGARIKEVGQRIGRGLGIAAPDSSATEAKVRERQLINSGKRYARKHGL